MGGGALADALSRPGFARRGPRATARVVRPESGGFRAGGAPAAVTLKASGESCRAHVSARVALQILKPVGYVHHLHVHSSYSLLEGALKIGDLVKAAGADRQPALALTDTNNLFGALEFSEKAAGSGIQPIAGMQLSVAFEAPEANAKLNASHPAHRAAGQGRDRLRPPAAARQPRLFRQPPRRGAAGLGPGAQGLRRRPDRAHRRHGRPGRCGVARQPPRTGARSPRIPQKRLRRGPSLRRAAAPRPLRRARRRGRADSARRPARPLAGGDERALLRHFANPRITRRTTRCWPSPRGGSSPTTSAGA